MIDENGVEARDQAPKRDVFLPASIIAAGVMISGSIIYLVGAQGGSQPGGLAAVGGVDGQGEEQATIEISGRDVILGDPNAPVLFLEYGDYQCPFCGRVFSQAEQRLREEYVKPGSLKMVYRNFAFLGPESFDAAEAAECAKDQQKFWGFHDALYTAEIADGQEHNGNLNRTLFLKIAGNLGLNIADFTECIDSEKYAEIVRAESDDARTLGVNSTPTVFINGTMIRGAVPYEEFASAIDKALSAVSE